MCRPTTIQVENDVSGGSYGARARVLPVVRSSLVNDVSGPVDHPERTAAGQGLVGSDASNDGRIASGRRARSRTSPGTNDGCCGNRRVVWPVGGRARWPHAPVGANIPDPRSVSASVVHEEA